MKFKDLLKVLNKSDLAVIAVEKENMCFGDKELSTINYLLTMILIKSVPDFMEREVVKVSETIVKCDSALYIRVK